MQEVYLSLGTNLGDRVRLLASARADIAAAIGPIIRSSAIYQTESWGGGPTQPDYLNQVLRVQTELDAEAVLKGALAIESRLGRTRQLRWESRLIDIDLLFYGKEVWDLPHLTVPHPRIQERNFVLIPLCEIAPTWVHPVLDKTIRELLEESEDTLEVRPFHPLKP